MIAFFKGANMEIAFSKANKSFNETDIPDETSVKIAELKEYLQESSNNNARKICIFGAGDWGIGLYSELTLRLINVDCFCDNNTQKHGYLVDNKKCVSFEELKAIKDDTLVIIAIKSATDAIKKQLSDNGFKYFITKQDIDKKFFDVPAIKWISSLDGIEDVNYSSSGGNTLVSKFNETIFDICKYYEDRIK
jgi:hypothetical protein